MNFVFLMDPLLTVKMEKDTSFILMLGAHRRGHNVYYLPTDGISLTTGHLHFHATKVVPQQVKDQPFIIEEEISLTEQEIGVVFIRTDPPFNYKYLMHSWLLDRLPPHIPVINKPAGIRTANEKIWATQFISIVPTHLVSQNRSDLLAFLDEEKNIVAKPTDGFGGQSVFQIKAGDSNANVILETLSANFTRDVILQEFVVEAVQGDKRILLLNGEPLGAVLRVHAENDHRNNFFSGGKPEAVEINDRDREIIEILKPKLQKLGLYFVGIDILGDYLIEVNVTSPTCLQEMNAIYNQQLEEKVIDFAEKLIKQNNSEEE